VDFIQRLEIMINEINKAAEEIKNVEEKGTYEFVTGMRKAESDKKRFDVMQKSRFDAINVWRAIVQQIEHAAPKTVLILDSKLNSLERTIKNIDETFPKRSFFNSKQKELHRHYVRKYLKGYDEVNLAVDIAQKAMIEIINKIIEDYNKYRK